MKLIHGVLSVALLVAAACGGAAAGTPIGTSPPSPGTAGPVSTTGPTPSGGPGTITPGPSSVSSGSPESAGPVPPPVHVDMKAPVASTMLADLDALGIDAKNLPPMNRLDPKALRGVMKLFTKALGGKCADCHLEGDFAAPTRRKKIATKMWSEFAATMTLADGSPLFCDSCHQGRIVQLDRTDKKALAKWMDTAFVDGLKQKSGKDTECETCHVGMEMKFLSIWGR
ncbi:MAG TPA: cytochrome c3 family protein [Polyangiaceae bacterium]|jgi:hypothetical protein